MKNYKFIRLILVGALILLGVEGTFAQRYYNQSYRPKRSMGSSRTDQGVLQKGYSFGFNALYYFGDVDQGKLPVANGFSIDDISASAFFAYHMPFSKHFGMRYTGTLGLLRADNTEAWANDGIHDGMHRKFTSVFLQPAAGVEVYPIDDYGLFIYIGIAATASYFTRFDYTQYADQPKPDFAFLPMGQASLGYTWNLTSAWQIGIHGMLQMGLLDRPYINLDGFPLLPSTKNRWPDGWFEIGLTIYYHPVKSLPYLRR